MKDANKILRKMFELKASHVGSGASERLAISIAFDYGRELIGFDICEGWRIAQIQIIEAKQLDEDEREQMDIEEEMAQAEHKEWQQLQDVPGQQLRGEIFQDKYDMYMNEY